MNKSTVTDIGRATVDSLSHINADRKNEDRTLFARPFV